MCNCHVFQLGKYDYPTCKCYSGFRLCTVFMRIYVCTTDISLDTLQHNALRKATLGMEKIISNINVLAIIAGLLLFFCKIKLPAVILAPINDIGNMLAPLSMIVTGMLMADSPILASLKNAKLYLFSAIRLVIWPTILLLIMCVSHVYEFIPDGRTLLLIVYLASITPSASTITQMVQVYNKDATYSSLLNVFTTLFCIITMPLAVILFSWLIL